MKLFYKKDYIRVSGDFEKLEKEYTKLEIKLEEEYKAKSSLEKQITDWKIINKENHKTINDLRSKLDEISDEKTKVVEELEETKKALEKAKNELEKTKKDLEESMTDKYLVKKIRPGRIPNTNKTRISAPMKSNVRRFMKENFD